MCKVMEDMRIETFKEGMEAGKKEGIQANKIEIAKKMLSDGGLPLEKIAQFTGLSIEKLRRMGEEETA